MKEIKNFRISTNIKKELPSQEFMDKHKLTTMDCIICGDKVVIPKDADIVEVKCPNCTVLKALVEDEEFLKKINIEHKAAEAKRLKRPRGWHWMKLFVDVDGNVYHSGKEQPELKGTLPPTVIEKKEEDDDNPKISKREMENLQHKYLVEIDGIKKKLMKAYNHDEKTKAKSLEKELSKVKRELKKVL